MNYSTAIFLISDAARGVMVSYEIGADGKGKQPFRLVKTLDGAVKVGDFVVVETETRHNMTVCRVEEIDVEPDLDATSYIKWIVGRVNLADFDDLKAQETSAIERIKQAEKRKRREELRKDLEDLAGEEVMAITFKPAAEKKANK